MFPLSRYEDQQRLASHAKDEGFQCFKKWVLSTYGDGSKTKTISWSKYLRIHKVLSGRSLGESPKFKFWVKSKGFCFLPCPQRNGWPSEMSGMIIALPNKKTSVERVYKRVAVVEEFFNIIYDIHVNLNGQNGKHAGQKRTYRMIIESYAFLPREAVTHFLMNCNECRSRMHLTPPSLETDVCWKTQSKHLPLSPLSGSLQSPSRCSSPTPSEVSIDVGCGSPYSSTMSVTEVTMSSAEGQSSNVEGDPVAAAASLEETAATCIESACSSRESSPPHSTGEVKEEKLPAPTPTKSEPKIHSSSKVETLQDDSSTEALLEKSLPKIPLISSPLKRSADSSLNLSPTMSKKSSDDADDDDEDEEDDKMLATTGLEFDPERLKAFNMFCRLFVDENLDRQVPISKQPKDKVQKILDACDRQFPEFRDRSRKRIRTYLKSCRRMRRTRELNGNNRDTSRPTPPHLTSPVAEQLLSVACENEAKNIRLINMGLEPSITTPKAKPVPNHITASSVPSSSSTLVSMPSLVPANIAQAATPSAAAAAAAAAAAHRMFPEWRFPHASHFRPDLAPFFGNGFFRPPFPGFPGHVPAAAALQASPAAAHLTLHSHPVNEITTPKKPSTPSLSISSSPSKGSVLTPAEVSSIRQLILGYRESATFLCKSADELEQLVSHAN